MTQRRRKRKRKGSTTNNIMRRRMGLVGWANSRRFFGWSKTLTTRTLGEGHNPGTIAGATFVLPVNNWNDPLGSLVNLVAGNGSLTANRHPMNHQNAINVGYERVQVLAWNARIDVNWIGGMTNIGDYTVAYSFNQDSGTEVTLSPGDDARIEILEIETNPRWTRQSFQSNPEVINGRPVFINIPNVFAYCKIIASGHSSVEATNGNCSHFIRDVDQTTFVPTIQLYCNVVIYQNSGLAMSINSIHVKVAITQRVKIMRDAIGGEDLDDGETTVHPA